MLVNFLNGPDPLGRQPVFLNTQCLDTEEAPLYVSTPPIQPLLQINIFL